MSVVREKNFVVKEIEGDLLTPVAVFKKLDGQKKFLLESSFKHEERGRYSFLGMNPYMEFIAENGKITVRDLIAKETEQSEGDPFKKLESYFPKQDDENLPFPFIGGAIGYIGYDSIRYVENIGNVPRDTIQMPDMHLMFYENFIVFDHLLQKVYILAMSLSRKKKPEELEKEVHQLEKMLDRPVSEDSIESNVKVSFTSNVSKSEYCRMVERGKDFIRKGDIFQVVLSQRLEAPYKGNPFDLYRKLRKTNPSPYMYYLDFSDYIVVGISPESLIKVSGRKLMTNPIAGTRPRGATDEEDRRLEKELLSDEKELAEHRMLVDLGRNDIGKVAEIGSVRVTKDQVVERYKHVMHIVSEVTGTLKNEVHSLEALKACLPAGTVSGAPKIRAMQIINDLEPEKRGLYSGAIGYLSASGDLDFAIAIRTMIVKDEKAYVQAGAGIVYDSVPEKEYEETLNKAKALLEVE
ncbi:anthranilate synthase component I [Bacillus sp. FSL W8-0102]|uniref:anthranilate synthase component I n=1 Tax=Bacillus sp. FSL W8-0102 TaxID=2978205 RepID=UPI00403FE08C